MKTLLIFVVGLMLMSCGSKKAGNSNESSSESAVGASVSINTLDLENITAANAASFVVSGSCSDNGQPVIVSVGEVNPETDPDCTNGAWSITLDVTGLNKREEISITADHSSATGSAYPQATTSVTNDFVCPENYVGISALSGYTTNSFCAMKYEAKSDSGDIVSQASGTPYVEINRDDSIDKCTGIGDGYDLITNDEWQSLARNIELVGGNWATGSVGNAGGLSRGHSDNVPSNALAASSNDNEGCHETGQTCSNTTWGDQRRTHTLSNGEVIWDIAGNVLEWVKDSNGSTYGSDSYIFQVTSDSHSASNSLSNGTTTTSRNAKDQFGPSGDYAIFISNPHGNLGYGFLNSSSGGVFRGGSWAYSGPSAGVFAVSLSSAPVVMNESLGFRCVFHP